MKYTLNLLTSYKETMDVKNVDHLKRANSGEKTTELLIDFTEKMRKYYVQYEGNNIHIMSAYLDIGFHKD